MYHNRRKITPMRSYKIVNILHQSLEYERTCLIDNGCIYKDDENDYSRKYMHILPTIIKDCLRCTLLVVIDPLLKRCNTITVIFYHSFTFLVRYVHILVVIEPVKISYDHSL